MYIFRLLSIITTTIFIFTEYNTFAHSIGYSSTEKSLSPHVKYFYSLKENKTDVYIQSQINKSLNDNDNSQSLSCLKNEFPDKIILNSPEQILKLIKTANAEEKLINYLTSISSSPRTLKQLREITTAMFLLGEIKSKSSLPLLSNLLLYSNNEALISCSAKTIGKIGGEKAYSILSEALIPKDRDCKYINRLRAVIIGLGYCNYELAENKLVSILKNSKNTDLLTLIYISGALGMHGNKQGYQYAYKGLSSPNTDILLAALSAIGFIGDSNAIKKVQKIYNSDNCYAIKKRCHLTVFLLNSKVNDINREIDVINSSLTKHPEHTEVVQSGINRLAEINTGASISLLKELSEMSSSPYLKFIAALKLNCIAVH